MATGKLYQITIQACHDASVITIYLSQEELATICKLRDKIKVVSDTLCKPTIKVERHLISD